MKTIHSFKIPVFLYLLTTGILTSSLISCTNCPGKEESDLPSQKEAIAAIKAKIEMANNKWAKGDPMGFAEMAAEDITWLDDLAAQSPVHGIDSLSAYLKNFEGKIPPHEHELSDMKFQLYDDIVIVTYRYKGTSDGKPANPWKVTSVFKYSDGDWHSVHENWSVIMKN